MSTPEERRKGAFEELEELLLEGTELDKAILIAATDNELKPEVLRTIAEKSLGDLSAYVERLALRRKNDQRHGEFLQALHCYIATFHTGEPIAMVPSAVEWLAKELGRSLSSDEERIANDRHISAVNFLIGRDFKKILRESGL